LLPSGLKLTLGLLACLLATITLEIVPCDSASITSVVSKWGPFSFIFSRGKRKSRMGWDDSNVVFGKEFPGENKEKRCIVMQQPVILITKFGAKYSRIFTQSP
jgi:hypothetical protein